jgi:site-specific DNA-methyltransferase (adenine-specific)
MTPAERQARRRKRVGKSMNRKARARYKQAKLSVAALARREASRNAPPLPDGAELRIGDCREVLKDIPADSVSLILTDPPYGTEAASLYAWLGEWAHRVLRPNGSLICFTGQALLYRDMTLLRRPFEPYGGEFWTCCELHTSAQRFMGKLIYPGWKPVLWYLKGNQRRPDLRAFVSDVLLPKRNKKLHAWAQGDGGVAPLIENLALPGELILDPFCGTGTWGRIAAQMGRRWIGCDIAEGGTTTILAT